MSYQTLKLADTSTLGINSTTAVSGTGWATVSGYRIFTGAGEQNDYTYAGVNLQSEKAGSLTFEFSQDGTNWSKYPVTEFSVAANINEVHGAWKGTRWIRPKFTQLSGAPQPDYFRLRTMYSDVPITLTAPLNQAINSDQDASVVRSITIGEGPTGTYQNEKTGGLAFSTSANLSAGQVFQTDVLDLRGYTQVETHIQTDAEGTLTFEFLSTPSTVIRTLNVPYTPPNFRTFAAPAFTPYVRYTFTATTSSSKFYYDTKFTTTSINGQILALDDFISPAMVANLGRNVIVAKKPGNNNLYSNVAIDSEARLKVSVPKTAFGELKVAEPTPIIQASFPYSTINSRIWNQTLSGAGGIFASNSTVSISADASGGGSSALLESVKYCKYRPGQGGLVRFTALFTPPSAGSKQEIGLGDDIDGFFFCTSGNQYAICRRRGGTDFTTLQADWNIDAAFGSQVLPMIDFTKGNVFQIEYQWLGYGAITYSVEEPDSGEFIPVHRDRYAGTEALPTVFNPTLPLRLYTESTTVSAPIVLKSASLFAGVEGKKVITGPNFAIQNSVNGQSNQDNFGIALENKATYSGADNRVPVAPNSLFVVNENSKGIILNIYQNVDSATLGGFQDVNTTDSVVQWASAGLNTYPTSALFKGTAIGPNDAFVFDFNDVELFPGENYVVTFTTGAASTDPVRIGFDWKEDF